MSKLKYLFWGATQPEFVPSLFRGSSHSPIGWSKQPSYASSGNTLFFSEAEFVAIYDASCDFWFYVTKLSWALPEFFRLSQMLAPDCPPQLQGCPAHSQMYFVCFLYQFYLTLHRYPGLSLQQVARCIFVVQKRIMVELHSLSVNTQLTISEMFCQIHIVRQNVLNFSRSSSPEWHALTLQNIISRTQNKEIFRAVWCFSAHGNSYTFLISHTIFSFNQI